MANITYLRAVIEAAGPVLVGDTDASASMALALARIAEGSARWTSAAISQHLPDTPYRVAVLEEVTALAGSAPAGLAGYLLGGTPVGRMFEVQIAGATPPLRRYQVITANGESVDGDNVISPPDFDAAANNKYLLRIQ